MGNISKIKEVSVDKLIPYINNAKEHSEEQVTKLAASIREFGFLSPVLIDNDFNVIAGHGRIMAAKKLGLEKVPCAYVEGLSDAQRKAYILADNKLGEIAEWDMDLVNSELEILQEMDFDIELTGFELPDDITETDDADHKGSLQRKFIVPPYSVLDTKQGYWQDRKRHWKAIIDDHGQGRQKVDLLSIGSRGVSNFDFDSASILDPVLSEIMVKWFCTEDGTCFDCFAGDTVFGYVCGFLGHQFTGIELRQEQVDFNSKQCEGMPVKYICDDARNVRKHIKDNSQDFFFSCPPYFDLEIYSDLENDASNQKTYEKFYAILDEAFTEAAKCLKENRFAVVVCGDVRNKKTGGYYGFCDDIIETFERNGLCLYNEIILLDAIGTAAIRANKYMEFRKVAKVHQNVLVFYKGDTKMIKSEFPEVEEIDESENMEF